MLRSRQSFLFALLALLFLSYGPRTAFAEGEEAEAQEAPQAAEGGDDGKRVRARRVEEGAGGAAGGAVGPRSMLQACSKDIQKFCSNIPQVPDKVGKCLTTNIDSLEIPRCRQWLQARSKCMEDSQKSGKCDKAEGLARCLARLAADEVSNSCSGSDFYKALQMYGRFKRRGIRQSAEERAKKRTLGVEGPKKGSKKESTPPPAEKDDN
jgi:hypothetical protein